MKTRVLVLVTVALLLVLASCAPQAGNTSPNALQIGETAELGQFLTDNAGLTLYMYTNDTTNTSTCIDTCAQNWPPLVIQGQPAAGEGVDASFLGTTQRADGSMQVTYKGHPLYYYAQDKNPGDTLGEAVKNVWYVVSPAGDPIQ